MIPDPKVTQEIYGNHSAIDVDAIIRRSEIELPAYELKQGILLLEKNGKQDPDMIDKLMKTTCAIANIGPDSTGKILVGVTDKKADSDRAAEIDGVIPKKVGKRFVVGVAREAKRVKLSVEKYFALLRDGVKNSALSEPLRGEILSNIDYNEFYGLGVIIITIPPQKSLSYFGDDVYWRNGDTTEAAKQAKRIAEIAGRFK
ncbi:MAG TPA: RNA-binding domain-containing protein [Rhizomicrobium sp.]|jgi:predicted HTH transcriptional regulator|nr:RNA-binding domain-containing protein [Rhizomicrobium sp.]